MVTCVDNIFDKYFYVEDLRALVDKATAGVEDLKKSLAATKDNGKHLRLSLEATDKNVEDLKDRINEANTVLECQRGSVKEKESTEEGRFLQQASIYSPYCEI